METTEKKKRVPSGSSSAAPRTPHTSPERGTGGGTAVKSPPTTPHKIQSLDEKSLRLDENYLEISPLHLNHHLHHRTNHLHHRNGLTVTQGGTGPPTTTAIIKQPLNSSLQNKAVKSVDSGGGGGGGGGERPPAESNGGSVGGKALGEVCSVRRRLNGTKLTETKLTDYFVQRRSNRKTQEALNAEKHALLVKAIVEGQQDGLRSKRFSGKGRGVVATKRFLRHEFVVEYAGELLTSGEARKREAKYAKDQAAGCYMYYFQYNNQQYCVDATKESDRLGRLINHSRTGNLTTKVVEVKGTPRLILIARRDIELGEELCYDYGDRSREALRHHPWLAN